MCSDAFAAQKSDDEAIKLFRAAGQYFKRLECKYDGPLQLLQPSPGTLETLSGSFQWDQKAVSTRDPPQQFEIANGNHTMYAHNHPDLQQPSLAGYLVSLLCWLGRVHAKLLHFLMCVLIGISLFRFSL
jgi:hypothetical protein